MRFGGTAGILLALTSWAAVLAYVTVAAGGTRSAGVQVFQLLCGLAALWSLFGVLAVHQVTRPGAAAWSSLVALAGAAASLATLAAALYTVAYVRANDVLPDIVPADPLHLATFGMSGLWLAAANALLWRTPAPRRLLVGGLAVAAVLLAGFVASLAGDAALSSAVALAAGAVGAPVYWIWLGLTLRRLA